MESLKELSANAYVKYKLNNELVPNEVKDAIKKATYNYIKNMKFFAKLTLPDNDVFSPVDSITLYATFEEAMGNNKFRKDSCVDSSDSDSPDNYTLYWSLDKSFFVRELFIGKLAYI